MALHRTVIDVSDLPELRRIAGEVRDTQESRILRLGSEEIVIIAPVAPDMRLPGRPKTQADYEAFVSAAGGWKGLVDGEDLKKQIKASRGSNRPPVDLTQLDE
jgi:hypothetical protein